ncbi:Protein C05E11.3 a [Aphelenchoides avenae]|nr:Protein C05E11.3 a [Aphelenchus avenae]
MGTDDASEKNTTGASEPGADHCCCRLLHVKTAALLIALLELLGILYQTFSASWSYAKTGDQHAFAFSLTLFSFALAFVAVVLLIVGIKKRSPYFLIPHILMQFAIIVSSTLLSLYITLLLIGGTSVKVDAIFYEDSPRGEFGLAQSFRHEPIRATAVVGAMNTLLLTLLLMSLVVIAFQVWFFVVVRRCYQHLQRLSLEKPALNGTSTSTVTQENNEMKV